MLWSCDEHDKSLHPLSDLDLNINSIHTHSIHTRYEHFSQAPFRSRIRSSGVWICREHSVQVSFNQEAKDMLIKVHQHLQYFEAPDSFFNADLIWPSLFLFIKILPLRKWIDWEHKASDLGSLSESSSFVKLNDLWHWAKCEISVHRTIASTSWTTDMTQFQTYSTTCGWVMCFIQLCQHILFSGWEAAFS